MRRICLLVSAVFLFAEVAFAIVDFQVLYGLRFQSEGQVGDESESDTTRSLMTHAPSIAIHTNPLKVAPVALGVTFTPISFFLKDEDDFEGISESEILEVSAELMAWLPMVPVVKPYLKGGYAFLGKKKEKEEGVDDDTSINFHSIKGAIGIKYSLPMMPMLGFILEGNIGKRLYQKEDSEEVTPLNERITAMNDIPITYYGVSLGVDVSI